MTNTNPVDLLSLNTSMSKEGTATDRLDFSLKSSP